MRKERHHKKKDELIMEFSKENNCTYQFLTSKRIDGN